LNGIWGHIFVSRQIDLTMEQPPITVAQALPRFPTLSDRTQSTFIDTILIVILMFVASLALEQVSDPPDWIRIVLFFCLWGIYEPVCTTLGCTFGNYCKKIRVRKVNDTSRRINILQAFVRYILKFALGWLSFLTMHANTKRRAIHDFAAGSVMICI
jgi:uncharacterized RDD family membrane protein YckC